MSAFLQPEGFGKKHQWDVQAGMTGDFPNVCVAQAHMVFGTCDPEDKQESKQNM